MQVRVLGTVFNLKSDKTNRSAVATLIKGEIEVKGNHEEGMIVLAPGQKAELNAVTRRLVVKQALKTGIIISLSLKRLTYLRLPVLWRILMG